MRLPRILSLVALLFFLPESQAHELALHSPAEDMAEAANRFLATLTGAQKEKASFAMDSEERKNWHFIPKSRRGLPLKEMQPDQQHLAHALLASAMSQRGYLTATTVMTLEQILHDMENQSPRRDPSLYFVSIFGEPSVKGAWAWRVEGHHLSLNFTVTEGGHYSVTPSFFGTNPGEVKSGPRQGLKTLAEEEDLARELVKSLTADQRKKAVIKEEAPSDIITGAETPAPRLPNEGITLNELNDTQKELFWKVVKSYVMKYRDAIAEPELKRLQDASPDQVFFAWAGRTEPGQGHYYRIQGADYIFEYDNTQNDANHVHAVWRDLRNDFGEDILRKHYEEHH